MQRRFIFKALLFSVLITCSSLAANAAEPHNVAENRLKTAFIYHLFNFTSWTGAEQQGSSTWKVCAWPGYSGLEELEALEGKKVGEKTVSVSGCQDGSCDNDCHILLLPDYKSEALTSYLHESRDASVLTVSSAASELASETLIYFFRDNRQLRMGIDYEATQRAGIQISSRLLRLMRVNSPRDTNQ